uniref:Uncharacterized protein n=1 Tax=Hanusia phi TaxID=3032 RepID=A0A7S0E4S5_9CRYP
MSTDGKRSLWKPWIQAKEEDELPEESLRSKCHRPVLREDVERCIRVGGGKLTSDKIDYLGIRVQPDFCSEALASIALREASELLAEHGYSHHGDGGVLIMDEKKQVKETLDIGNTLRCTGRQEFPEQSAAPWGYGDDFQVDKVPPALRAILKSIQDSQSFCVGKPRDLTINRRTNGFFKLDPHLDPVLDGENVFILNLLSNAVITFVPPGEFQRKDPVQIALRSWTDQDVDVLMKHRTLVLFSGKSRNSWRHAIRTGLQVEIQGGQEVLCDWWGTPKNLVRRSNDRISLVFAFGGKTCNQSCI